MIAVNSLRWCNPNTARTLLPPPPFATAAAVVGVLATQGSCHPRRVSERRVEPAATTRPRSMTARLSGEYPLCLRRADQIRAAIQGLETDLQIIMTQLERLPTLETLARTALITALAGAAPGDASNHHVFALAFPTLEL